MFFKNFSGEFPMILGVGTDESS